MSDRDDLKEVQSFLSTLIANLKNATAQDGNRDAAGGLFPTGINDIFAKLKVGAVTLEFEVSAANSIHGTTLPQSPVVSLEPIASKAVRPMSVTITPAFGTGNVIIWFTVTAGGLTRNYSPLTLGVGVTEIDLETGKIISISSAAPIDQKAVRPMDVSIPAGFAPGTVLLSFTVIGSGPPKSYGPLPLGTGFAQIDLATGKVTL